ncbi:uncharacterized protein LOC143291206 [Babylonia areolata]|uniref:uncharacterized protein LOC143291206 n=1 Tax=Babylonia areolata TaxID=304850 RepID=UPI003FD5A5D1
MTSSSDITLLLTSDGKDWGKYLSDRLSGFPQVSHASLDLSDPQRENPAELKSACRRSAVVLLLATQGLLNYMQKRSGYFVPALRELSSTASVVVLLLLDRKYLDDVTHRYGYITGGWRYTVAGDTPVEVQQKIAEVLDIVDQNRQARSERTLSSSSRTSSKLPVQFFPSTVYERNTKVAMVFKEDVQGEVTLKLEQTDQPLIASRETTTVFTFTAPQKPSGKYYVTVLVDNRRQRGRPELTFRGTEVASLTSPRYLAEALCLPNVQDLDLRLRDLFNDSVPADQGLEVLFRHLPDLDPADRHKNADTQYPTLLHYAAAFGLSEFCAALLDCPGSYRAFSIRNCDGLDPAELAAENGFDELEDYILDFMEIQVAASDAEPHYMKMDISDSHTRETENLYENPIVPWLREATARSPTSPRQQGPALPPRPEPRVTSSSTTPSSLSSPSPALPPRPEPCVTSSSTTPSSLSSRSPALPPRPEPRVTSSSTTPSSPSSEYWTIASATSIARRPPISPPPPHSGVLPRSVSMAGGATVQEAGRQHQQHKAASLPRKVSLDSSVFTDMDSTQRAPAAELPEGALGSRSQSELIGVQELVKSQEINQNEAHMLFKGWQQRYGRSTAASFKDRQKGLMKIKSEFHQRFTEQEKRSHSVAWPRMLLSRLRLGGRQRKAPGDKLNISEPVLSPTSKKATKRYIRVGSDSQLPMKAADRDSRLFQKADNRDSTASSSGSSRDSGCSQRDPRHSNMSLEDHEAEEDDVFGHEATVLRRRDQHPGASSTKRLSLGSLYLQQALDKTERNGSSPPSRPSIGLPPLPHPS